MAHERIRDLGTEPHRDKVIHLSGNIRMERFRENIQPVFRYKVVIVDDEPMAVKAIERVVERSCPDFQTVGTAVNGKQALALIRELKPDLVLTDITMPVMDGLELAKTVREEDPDICFVIISGYQDYEYMRSAIQSGVLDYLGKPIVPSQIVAMMERVKEKLRTQVYHRRNALLRAICGGEEVSREAIRRYFPFPRYYAALLRENGLPRRFFRGGEPELFGSIDEAYSVYGRDSMEELFLIPAWLLTEVTIGQYMEKVRSRQKSEGSYTTLLYYGSAFSPEEIPQKVQGLYHWLNALSTVGRSQKVDLDRIAKEEDPLRQAHALELNALLSELDSYAKNRHFEQMKQKLERSFMRWGEEGRPQLWMENASRRILNLMQSKNLEEGSLLEREYHLEEAFCYATDIRMLCDNLKTILYSFQEEQKEKPKVDSPAFFDDIRRYLEAHLDQPLSLQSLCDEFAISQAYMSKLFRKYADQSYAQYLTGLRMERAKQLMREETDLYIKDIARMVGYRDQFYFSRIFRSYTGRSPADYMKVNM